MTETTNEMPYGKFLVVALRLLGLLDLCAFAAAIAPRSWIAFSHAGLGLGAFPQEPIAGLSGALHFGLVRAVRTAAVVRRWRCRSLRAADHAVGVCDDRSRLGSHRDRPR